MSHLRQTWLLFSVSFLIISCTANQAAVESTACSSPQFNVVADFPGGNYGECRFTDDDIVVMQLQPENVPINPSPWYSFRVAGTGRLNVVIEYGEHRHRYAPKVSGDGFIWESLGGDQYKVSADNKRLSLRLDVTTPVYISAQENMNSAWYDNWYADLRARWPQLSQAEIGRSAGDRPLIALQSNPDAPNSVLFVGRQHPPEVTGAIAMEAFVEALFDACPSSQLACDFHKKTNVVLVPLMNPDGVDLGFWRHALSGRDLNRGWGTFRDPETQAIQQLIERINASSQLRGFLDFHSTYRDLFYTQSPDDLTLPEAFAANWFERAREKGVYEFSHEPRHNTTLATSKNYMYRRFGIPAITYEVGDETDRDTIRSSAAVFADTYIETLYPYRRSHDLAFVNGTVVDGTGRKAFTGTVAVTGKHITYVGTDPVDAERVIDATNLVISPGFIDPHTHADGDLQNPDRAVNAAYLRQGVTTVVIGNDGYGAGYEDTIVSLAPNPGTNVGIMTGHGYLRSKHVGPEAKPATKAQQAAMEAELDTHLRNGSLGLSTGLFYAPGSYAPTEEVIGLATIAAKWDAIYDSHIRDEATYTVGLMGAIEEALEIGRASGVDIHISHIKALGPDVWGQSKAIIEAIEAAQAEGVTVTADQYPWLASGTRLSNALFPRSAQSGGRAAFHARLRDPQYIAAIYKDIVENLRRRGGATQLLIAGTHPDRGKTLAESAGSSDPEAAISKAIEIVLAGDPAIASFMMNIDDVDDLAMQSWVVTGSDGSTGHPRKYATFPKKYQDYVADNARMSVEQFVMQSSYQTARILNLCDRGELSVGKIADIAVWDPRGFKPRATYRAPTELAAGVEYLAINGSLAIDAGAQVPQGYGEVMKRQACVER